MQASYTVYGSEGFLPPLSRLVCCQAIFGAGGASTEGYLVRNHPPFWYTDGSGGKYAQDERLIRSGWGAESVTHMVTFQQRAAVWGALYGPLPGELQGSDRAEVWAILQLQECTWVIWSEVRNVTTSSSVSGLLQEW